MADAVRDGVWFLEGGGRMATAIRDFDWAATPLGPMEDWPASLKMVVSAILNSHFPKCITWGPEFITIYNDAFRPILGEKPEALGQSFRDIWHEVWDEIAPILAKAYAGEATFIEDLPLVIDRHGYPEQAWFTFCYSPIRDEEGRIVGMMDTVMETTAKVVTQRNARLLNDELSHRIKNILTMVGAIARQALSLALAINELATNALKYGALSNDTGQIRVSWDAGPPETDCPFRLLWREENGPAVTAPNRRGFGSRLIEHVLADSFTGKARLTFDKQGVRLELTTTMNSLLA